MFLPEDRISDKGMLKPLNSLVLITMPCPLTVVGGEVADDAADVEEEAFFLSLLPKRPLNTPNTPLLPFFFVPPAEEGGSCSILSRDPRNKLPLRPPLLLRPSAPLRGGDEFPSFRGERDDATTESVSFCERGGGLAETEEGGASLRGEDSFDDSFDDSFGASLEDSLEVASFRGDDDERGEADSTAGTAAVSREGASREDRGNS